jgi:hypothetical protein
LLALIKMTKISKANDMATKVILCLEVYSIKKFLQPIVNVGVDLDS